MPFPSQTLTKSILSKLICGFKIFCLIVHPVNPAAEPEVSKGFFGDLFSSFSSENQSSALLEAINRLQNDLSIINAENTEVRQNNFLISEENSRLKHSLQQLEDINRDLLIKYEDASNKSYLELCRVHRELQELKRSASGQVDEIATLEQELKDLRKSYFAAQTMLEAVRRRSDELQEELAQKCDVVAEKDEKLSYQFKYLAEASRKISALQKELDAEKVGKYEKDVEIERLAGIVSTFEDKIQYLFLEKKNYVAECMRERQRLVLKLSRVVSMNKKLLQKVRLFSKIRCDLRSKLAELKLYAERIVAATKLDLEKMTHSHQLELEKERLASAEKIASLLDRLRQVDAAYLAEKSANSEMAEAMHQEKMISDSLRKELQAVTEISNEKVADFTKVTEENNVLKKKFEALHSAYCKDLNDMFCRSIDEKNKLQDFFESEVGEGGVTKSLNYYSNICEKLVAHKELSSEAVKKLKSALDHATTRYHSLRDQYKGLEERLNKAYYQLDINNIVKKAKPIKVVKKLGSDTTTDQSESFEKTKKAHKKYGLVMREMHRKDNVIRKLITKAHRQDEVLDKLVEENFGLKAFGLGKEAEVARVIEELELLRRAKDSDMAEKMSEINILAMEKDRLAICLSKALSDNQILEQKLQDSLKTFLLAEMSMNTKVAQLSKELAEAKQQIDAQKQGLLMESLNIAGIAMQSDAVAREAAQAKALNERNAIDWNTKFEKQKHKLAKLKELVSFYKRQNSGLRMQLQVLKQQHESSFRLIEDKNKTLSARKKELKNSLAEQAETIVKQNSQIALLTEVVNKKAKKLKDLTMEYRELSEQVHKIHAAKNHFAFKMLEKHNHEKAGMKHEHFVVQDALKSQLAELAKENDNLRKNLAALEAKLDKNIQEYDAATENLKSYEAELMILKESMAMMHNENHQILFEKGRLVDRVNSGDVKMAELERNYAAVLDKISRKKQKIAKLKGLIDSQGQQVEKIEQALAEKASKAKALEEQKAVLLSEVKLQQRIVDELKNESKDVLALNQKQAELIKTISKTYGSQLEQATNCTILTKQYFDKLGLLDDNKNLNTGKIMLSAVEKELDSVNLSDDNYDISAALKSVLVSDTKFEKLCDSLLPLKGAIHNIVSNDKFLQNARPSEIAEMAARKSYDLKNLNNAYKSFVLRQKLLGSKEQTFAQKQKDDVLWKKITSSGADCLGNLNILKVGLNNIFEENAFTSSLANALVSGA